LFLENFASNILDTAHQFSSQVLTHTRRLQRALKRRNPIEPVIGHLKNDGLLRRNCLKGELGDALHAILCGAGHNIRLILRRLKIFWPHDWQTLCPVFARPSSVQFLLSV
jgi:IS5 family transposase